MRKWVKIRREKDNLSLVLGAGERPVGCDYGLSCGSGIIGLQFEGRWRRAETCRNDQKTWNIRKKEQILLLVLKTGLPWWCSGWESACQCRGHGFEPWSGRIPHAAEQLGPWTTTTEPACLEPVLRDSERPAHRDEEWPPLAATRESPRTERKTQHSQNK